LPPRRQPRLARSSCCSSRATGPCSTWSARRSSRRFEDELPDEIAGPNEYALVADLEERLGLFIGKAEPLFDEHCNAAHKVWKSACSIRSLFLDAPKALKLRARTLLGAYKTREERERREAERRIAEEERQRQIERQKQEAKLLEKQGQKEMAAAVRAQPVSAPAVTLPSAVPVVQGADLQHGLEVGGLPAARTPTAGGRIAMRASAQRPWCRGNSSTWTTRRLPRASTT
jgi:hypothetical protein